MVEPYNAILSIAQLLSDTDLTFVCDNEALFKICHHTLKLKDPSFSDLNWLLSLAMGGITASLRFPGILNCDLRKMGVNLVPFPRLHFFTSAYSPLFQRKNSSNGTHTRWSLQRISDDCWRRSNALSSVRTKKDEGKFLSASIMYRGSEISSAEIDNITRRYLDRKHDHFVEWIPHNVKTSIITLKPEEVDMSATMIGNITSVRDCFERIWSSFHKLFKKKAFLHWYHGEGLHELDFVDAEKEIQELILEYFEKQEVVLDLDAIYQGTM